MKYRERILRELKEREGIELKAYWDPHGKVWTIGKGNTFYPDGRPVKQGDVITQQQADELVEWYVDKNLAPLLDKYTDLSEDEYCALVSFGFNCGPGTLQTSTLAKFLQAAPNDLDVIERRKARIAIEMMQFIMAGGQPILRGRRLIEAKEFLGYV